MWSLHLPEKEYIKVYDQVNSVTAYSTFKEILRGLQNVYVNCCFKSVLQLFFWFSCKLLVLNMIMSEYIFDCWFVCCVIIGRREDEFGSININNSRFIKRRIFCLLIYMISGSWLIALICHVYRYAVVTGLLIKTKKIELAFSFSFSKYYIYACFGQWCWVEKQVLQR